MGYSVIAILTLLCLALLGAADCSPVKKRLFKRESYDGEALKARCLNGSGIGETSIQQLMMADSGVGEKSQLATFMSCVFKSAAEFEKKSAWDFFDGLVKSAYSSADEAKVDSGLRRDFDGAFDRCRAKKDNDDEFLKCFKPTEHPFWTWYITRRL